MKLNILPGQFEELIKKRFSLDQVYFLGMVNEGWDTDSMCKGSVNINLIKTSLIRKGLLSEEGEITLLGQDVLKFVERGDENAKIIKRTIEEDDFERWWKTFPGKDTFSYKGVQFEGSRTLRVARKDCKLKFTTIVMEGKYTADELIQALEYDVLRRMEQSYKTRTNKLQFIPNSNTYLYNRVFEPYIEDIRSGKSVITSKVIRGTDI